MTIKAYVTMPKEGIYTAYTFEYTVALNAINVPLLTLSLQARGRKMGESEGVQGQSFLCPNCILLWYWTGDSLL